jgi:hypothetical protein
MMRRRTLLVGGAVLLSIAASSAVAPAQEMAPACDAVTRLETGYWAAYRLSGTASDAVSSVQFAIVGQEQSDGEKGYWYEFQAETNQGPMIIQLLITKFPFSAEDVREMVMKVSGQPALKLSSNMLETMRQQMGPNPMKAFTEMCSPGGVVGEETVTVPAGTFGTLHVRDSAGEGEAWISDDVPFGIVKGNSKDGTEMVLTEYGRDAVSSITETPQEMPGRPNQ